MKIQRELLDKYLVRDIESKDESIYIFPRVIEIDVEEENKEHDCSLGLNICDSCIDKENTNEDNNDTNNGE